jgi:putative DNA methylase
MIPKECKRLAEVDFPIAAVSKHAPMENGIPMGHPSRMHLWWARRPLAACRTILLALLLPDPCDENCPHEFINKARTLLEQIPGKTKQLARAAGSDLEGRKKLRTALLSFIGDLANWRLSFDRDYLEVSRGLVKAAHGEEPPLVVDPFAGGGSIPLEALRLGCDAFASDLNPVACLILKTMLEDVPRYEPGFTDELRRVGAEIKSVAEKELEELYPDDPDGAKPMAYLWARTVRCEMPNCGAEIPLARSLWLCKKANRKRALRYQCVRPAGKPPRVEFEIFGPNTDAEVSKGTVSRAKATCPCCNMTLSPDRVRAQLTAQHGGADVIFSEQGRRIGGARLLAVVTLRPQETGRHYRLPTERDYESVRNAQARVAKMLDDWKLSGTQGLCPIPDELLPPIGTLGFRVQRYGMLQWGDLFTARQKVSLSVVAHAISASQQPVLALALGKLADLSTSGCLWHTKNECPNQVFTTARVKPFWDFAEGVPTSDSSGSIQVCVAKLIGGLLSASVGKVSGDVQLAAAQQSPLPSQGADIWFTDPPYYDAVPYADLSDFFLVWLKRALPGHPLLRDPFDSTNRLSPKRMEAVQDESKRDNERVKDRRWFEESMALAFVEGGRVLRDDGVGTVVLAHKTTEGWEALLSGMIRGGWTITGSWPIATEMVTRLRARESAALATSVHLVCRPRSDNRVGDWARVLRELPNRVGDWMERLQSEGMRGADLVFACIGPALEIYSQYEKVVDAEERQIPLGGDPEAKEAHERGYLAYVWEVVGRTALEQVLGTAEAKARNGAAGALEEDARLTALFLWTLQSTNGNEPQNYTDKRGEDEEEVDVGDEEDDEPNAKKKKKGFTLI